MFSHLSGEAKGLLGENDQHNAQYALKCNAHNAHDAEVFFVFAINVAQRFHHFEKILELFKHLNL